MDKEPVSGESVSLETGFLFVAFGSKAPVSKKNGLVVRSLVKRTVLREGKGLSSVVVVNFVVLGESTMPFAGQLMPFAARERIKVSREVGN